MALLGESKMPHYYHTQRDQNAKARTAHLRLHLRDANSQGLSRRWHLGGVFFSIENSKIRRRDPGAAIAFPGLAQSEGIYEFSATIRLRALGGGWHGNFVDVGLSL
jgi:hypothetical protein